MNDPLTSDQLAQWKQVFQRSGDRVSMHRELALALITTAEQLRTDADTLRQARELAAEIREHIGEHIHELSILRLLDLLAPPDTGAEP